ncbi:MAG: peptidoglycan-associated lipoprotein Pal [Pseudomonadota bacterium]
MKMNKVGASLVLLVCLGLSACGGNKSVVPMSDSSSQDAVAPAGSGVDTAGEGDSSSIRSTGFVGDSAATETADALIIYFQYDKSEVSPQYADLLGQHARRLVADPTQQLRLEGHADERGSREYNIGLGERRAQAVRRLLMIQGVSSAQISTVSYGEERPAALGSTESDYEKNRRVELSYR